MRDEVTEQARSDWNRASVAWVREREWLYEQQRAVSDRLVAAMDAGPNVTIVELAGGAGETGMALAEQAPDARVIISDIAPGMVAAIVEGVRARGLRNVDVREIDAQQIDLLDASARGVLCRYGLMLVPDRDRAFAEIARILEPGGALAYAVWGPMTNNPWMWSIAAGFAALDLIPPLPDDPVSMPLATEDENRAALSGAFVDIEFDVASVSTRYESVDAYFDLATGISKILGEITATRDSGAREELVSSVGSVTNEFLQPDGSLVFPTQSLVVRARRT